MKKRLRETMNQRCATGASMAPKDTHHFAIDISSIQGSEDPPSMSFNHGFWTVEDDKPTDDDERRGKRLYLASRVTAQLKEDRRTPKG